MDRRERVADDEEMMRMALGGLQGAIWTALPGIIDSFDADAMTCKVQPAVSGVRLMQNGDLAEVRMPLLLDCPVCFPGGGGATLTFPIKPGDECLVVFASRCIDSWWQLGGVRGQAEIRMHDLSDGFVLPGVRSQPRKFSVSTTAAQLRSDDGAAYVEINPNSHKIKALTSGDIEVNAGGAIKATAGGSITMEAPSITLKGNIVLDGPITQTSTAGGGTTAILIGPLNVTNDVVASGKSLKTHVHSGVQAGGGNTGQPV